MENNKLGQIYCLKNPITNEIFYIGATTKSLQERLNKHYWDINALNRGERENNKRFEYRNNLLPVKAIIELIEEVSINLLDEKEKYYIEYYKNINPNLTNTATGGKGGDIYSNHLESRKQEISAKISKANKGKKKPEGFATNLSITRMGKDNPNCKELEDWVVGSQLYLFKYKYEINNFIGSKDAYGNIKKLIGKTNRKAYGRSWLLFSSLSTELQDIVRNLYESKDE